MWAYFNIFETKNIPLEEISEKFGAADEVVVHLSETMADPGSRKHSINPEAQLEKGEGAPTEHIESSAKTALARENR